MIEIIDNALQLFATACCTVLAGIHFQRKKEQSYLLATCFYGTFALGQLYWLIYLFLANYTPKIFYVSDLSWIASFVFLLVLDVNLEGPEERAFKCPAAWISPILGLGLMLFYMQWGDYLTNFLWCGITAATGWVSIRGLLFAQRQSGKARDRQFFHAAVLFVILTEYALWTSSCFWVGDTLANSYFWFDFALTAGLIILLPAIRKAVDE